MGVQLAGPVIKSPGYRVVKLRETAECVKCGWALDPDEVALVVGELVFCKEACFRKAVEAAFEIEIGDET